MLKTKPFRSIKHRRYISRLSCCVSGLEGSTQCAHIRKGNGGGMGYKPSDLHCVPLSVEMHAKQGEIGERLFWAHSFEAANKLAIDLSFAYPDVDLGERLVKEFRETYFPWGSEIEILALYLMDQNDPNGDILWNPNS